MHSNSTTVLCAHILHMHTFILLQKLEADEEDSYLNTEWADPQALKRQFTGMSNISWRPK